MKKSLSTHQHGDRATPAQDAIVAIVRRELGRWYRACKRDLPWRATRDPYRIWLSEVMLQQTRVETVIPYYERFLAAFPTVVSLAEAPLDAVLARWSGLGYYRRARLLHEGARQVARDHGGRLPRSAEGLRAIRGVGRYTAGAVASIAFGLREPLLDGNVARVLARVFVVKGDARGAKGQARLWAFAGDLVAGSAEPGDLNQALMELGALVCTPRAPRCEACPVATACGARRLGLQASLPVLAKKKAPVAWARVAVVARRGPAVLLARRQESLLFGGMWEPPMTNLAGDTPPLEAASALVSLRGARVTGTVVHVLSHRRMTVTVVAGELRATPRRLTGGEYSRCEPVTPAALEERALSTLARKVLRAAEAPSAPASPRADGRRQRGGKALSSRAR